MHCHTFCLFIAVYFETFIDNLFNNAEASCKNEIDLHRNVDGIVSDISVESKVSLAALTLILICSISFFYFLLCHVYILTLVHVLECSIVFF